MAPQDLKNIIGSGLLSFPLTAFDATAGIVNSMAAAPTSAPRATLVPRCIGSPRIVPFTARSLGRGPQRFIVHMSKIRAAAFGPPVEGRTRRSDLWPRG